ncbi:MFS transporter [Sphingomonas sp. SORGH_AS_0879]|uniref:MFS transporter n=1 Tax=Sphingomonas sp. SORGH_AS_0879 TaxID=3041790 RepID=UPI00278158CC|nr:MFS transporter [Sphingomonas sp. SORGH_AS_0879]MDQ1228641.1 sugar phosphate permease [Sphingomonas sp. SORGH_AS_0879]
MSARPVYRGWHMVGAVLVALMLCGTTTIVTTFGIVTAHLTRAFGWSQGAMASALSLFLLATTLAVPVVGIAVDRFGSRRTAMAGTLAFAALLALAGGGITSLRGLMVFYALFGAVGAFTNPIVYIKALSAWFDRRRGFALGLAVAGQGVGGAILPMAVESISEAFGWRHAFHALAAGLILLVLPLVALFVRDDPAEAGVPFADAADPVRIDQPAVSSGLTVAQALRTRAFWIIIAVFLLFGMTSYALTANFVALMLQRGAGTLPQIAMLSSIAGVAMIVGRLVFGWLLDRFPVPIVGAGGVLCAAAALGILLRIDSIGVSAVTMSVLMGVAMGAETDLLSILVGRYFGQRAISRIYAWHNVSFLLGAAMGPPLFAMLLGRFASADIPILTLIALVILSAALLLLLRSPRLVDRPRYPSS